MREERTALFSAELLRQAGSRVGARARTVREVRSQGGSGCLGVRTSRL
jgi:hypothetical protein